MRRPSWASLVLLALIPAATWAAGDATNQGRINHAFTSIHQHVCDEIRLGPAPCPLKLSDEERWAFVFTWCARRPPGQNEVACADLPKGGGPVVIAFDHDGKAWRPIHGVDDRDLQPDANGVPKVLTSSGRTVLAVVESTNPLVYRAEAGAITEADAAIVGNLKKVFEQLRLGLRGFAVPEISEDALGNLEKCTLGQWDQARNFTQHVEDHESAKYMMLATKEVCNRQEVGKESAVMRLRRRLDELARCTNEAAEAVAAAKAFLAPENESAVKTLESRLDELAKCTNETAEAVSATRAILSPEKESAGEALIWRLDELAKGTTEEAKAVAAANALLTEERLDELEAIARKIKEFERLLVDSAATTRPITEGIFETTDVADFFVVRQGSIVVEWTKERSRTLTIVKASPFEKLSTNRPDSVTTSYGAASLAASLVDLNVALTYTPLSSPVFGIVSEPAPTAAEPGAMQTVIRQTDEDSRSGECALLVSLPVFLPMGDSSAARRFALVLGTGASSSNPALFLGLSAKLYGGVQVSAGVTRQQVKALDGQSLGEPIAAATDIRLENDWDTQFFASVSLSLRGIGGLFGSP